MDTACARLALGQTATPPAIEDATRTLDDLEVQRGILERETAIGANHAERLEDIARQKVEVEAKLKTLRERWNKESELVSKIRDIHVKLEAPAGKAPAQAAAAPAAGTPVPPAAEPVAATPAPAAAAATPAPAVEAAPAAPAPTPEALRAELAKLEAELAQVQGENPMMRVAVDAQIVGEVLAAWTGIPVGKMLKNEIETILTLSSHLGKRVIGQEHALDMISQRVQTSRAALDDPQKPIGVFMLIGPSGVGKTESALALADLLYGGEHNLITINMSEFQEAHTVSTLKGSPPGYVGYGEGGVLTEAVRRRPYSVVLLDEVEKAHPDVLELFYQVFDKGMMEDGEGREIDFKNTIIILTTNACTDQMMKLTADPETMPTAEGIIKAMRPELNKIFKPAFLGRMVLIPFYPIREDSLKLIIELKMSRIQKRIEENHRIKLSYDAALVDTVASRCTEVESGARNVDNILTNTLLPDMSRNLLGKMAEGEKITAIHVGIGPDGAFVYN